MFQSWIRTPPDLGSVNNCYVAILLIPAPPFSALHPISARGGIPANVPSLYPFLDIMYPHRIIHPPGHHIYLSENTKAHHSLHQTPLTPCLPCPRHAFRIPNDVPLPLPKSLLTLHSSASEMLFAATTAQGTSPLTCSPYICCKTQVLASTPPTTSLSPASFQCTSPVSDFPLP